MKFITVKNFITKLPVSIAIENIFVFAPGSNLGTTEIISTSNTPIIAEEPYSEIKRKIEAELNGLNLN